jgi:hypothetical protein
VNDEVVHPWLLDYFISIHRTPIMTE